VRIGLQFPIKIPTLRQHRPAYSEDFYQSLLELVPHAALLVDTASQTIRLANSKSAELSAYTRAELSGLGLFSLFENWESHEISCFGPTPRSGTPVNVEQVPLIQRNNQRVPVTLTCIFIEPSNKNTLIVLQLPQESQTRERTNREFWEWLRRLLSSLWETDPDEAIELAFDVVLSMTGGKAGALYQSKEKHPELLRTFKIGETYPFPDKLPIQDLARLSKPNRWSAGKRPISSLHRNALTSPYNQLITAPVGQFNAHIGLVAIAGDEGLQKDEVLFLSDFLGNILNIILGHRAQLNRLNSEIDELNHLISVNALIQERISEGFIRLTNELDIIEINQPAELMLGYTNFEAYGQPIESILIANQQLGPTLIAAQEASPTYNLGNIRLYRRNGESFLAHVRVFPVVHEGGVKEIIIFIQDLSEQEQMRRQAQEFEQRAILGEVTAVFAHEVRNPINNISTGLQLMSYCLPEDDKNQESIQRMLQDCDRLANLLKSVLAISRPTDYEMEVLELPTLLRNLLQRLEPRITRKNIQFNLKIEPDCPPIMGNLRALEQVFSNLIQNAVQAMEEEGGRLGIKVAQSNGHAAPAYVEVSVADTGPGIPKEIQENIFQPFMTTKKNGTGLGLAISKRIITAHKGNVSVNSFPGGTVFSVQIPTIQTE
jgi:PAS domain S-box-containing protein